MKTTAEYLFYNILPLLEGNYEVAKQYRELLETSAISTHKLPYWDDKGQKFEWFPGCYQTPVASKPDSGKTDHQTYKQYISEEDYTKLKFEIEDKVDQLKKDLVEKNPVLSKAMKNQKRLQAKIQKVVDKVPEEMDCDPWYNYIQHMRDTCGEEKDAEEELLYNIEELLFEADLVWDYYVDDFAETLKYMIIEWNEGN